MPVARPVPPDALSEELSGPGLVEVLNSDRFADKAPRQVWAALLDEGVYLASVSTMYRELRRRPGPGAAPRRHRGAHRRI